RVILAAAVFGVIVAAAAGADWLAPYPFDEMHVADRLHGPSLAYLAGTDEYGRDVLSRTLYGGRPCPVLWVVAAAVGVARGHSAWPAVRLSPRLHRRSADARARCRDVIPRAVAGALDHRGDTAGTGENGSRCRHLVRGADRAGDPQRHARSDDTRVHHRGTR